MQRSPPPTPVTTCGCGLDTGTAPYFPKTGISINQTGCAESKAKNPKVEICKIQSADEPITSKSNISFWGRVMDREPNNQAINKTMTLQLQSDVGPTLYLDGSAFTNMKQSHSCPAWHVLPRPVDPG